MIQATASPSHLVITGASADFKLQAAEPSTDGKPRLRKFTMTAYTGGPLSVAGFGLPVVVDLAGMKVPSSKRPILRDHDRARIVGHSERIEVTKNNVALAGTLSGIGADANEIIALADNGFPWQASIGAKVDQLLTVNRGETATVNGQTFDGPIYVARASTLGEVSFVAIGADGNSSATVSAHLLQGTPTMTYHDWLKSIGIDPATGVNDANRSQLQASYAKVHPAGGVAASATAADLESTLQGGSSVLIARAMQEGWSVDRAREEGLAFVRASRTNPPGIISGTKPAIGTDHLAAAILLRSGNVAAAAAYGDRVVAESQSMQRKTLLDLCETALRIEGREVPIGSTQLIRAGFTTISLPKALSGASDRILETAYRETPATWRRFAGKRSAKNFREQTSLRVNFAGTMEKVGQDGEIKHGKVSEGTFTWGIATYARQFRLTRQMIINDDLSVFNDLLPALGRAGLRTTSDLVYQTLLANAASFFHADHNNLLTGGGSALSALSLASAVTKLRAQKGADGENLDLAPATLVVPPELEATARSILNSMEVARTGADLLPTGNAMQGIAELEVEPRLSNTSFAGSSATQWYLFASAADLPMVIGFLDGKEGPTVEMLGLDSDPDTLGYTYRGWIDVGAALGEYRAAVKANGA